LVTKASVDPPRVLSKAPSDGKFVEEVSPVTYTLPEASTAMARGASVEIPPR